MKSLQHTKCAQGRWIKKTFTEQMAQIGSEVYRAIKWKSHSNDVYGKAAFDRSLELFDLSKNSKLSPSQFRELTRMRELWVDYFQEKNEYNSTSEWINGYFTQMAVAVRNSRV